MNKLNQRQFDIKRKKTRRPLRFIVLGVFLLCIAGGLIYDRLQAQSKIVSTPEPFKYSTKQTVDTRVKYRKNSFFDASPNLVNSAYLTELTDSIEAQFNLQFDASKATELAYQYQATAVIQALYGSDKTDEAGMAKVWSKQYTLLEPTKGNSKGTSVTLKPVVQIPYAAYYKQMEEFRNAFSAPINSEMIITYTVHLTGNINGIPFQETKISAINVPLDQQIYKVNTQFEKASNKEIKLANGGGFKDVFARYEIPLAIVFLVAGIVLICYGFRRQLIKSPHQRKLEKIYRYHDGIIVRAKQPPDLLNKNIVTITSFDDMLNLEEELKTPIIASKVSDYTTHFFITREDIAYVFTLGIPIPFKDTLLNSNSNKDQPTS